MASDLEQGDLAELFGALASEFSASGALYAYFDEEQALKAVVSLPGQDDFAPVLRLSGDPITRVLLDGKPRAFTLYEDATALDQPTLNGRSTLAYPLCLRGVPVGLALFVSRRTELGEGDIARVGAWSPHLARALESAILAERLTASRRENEALLAISRLAQSPSSGAGLFANAVTHIRHLTGAQHAAIALRPRPQAACLALEALATDGDQAVRQAFEQGAWDPREWPHLLASLTLGSRAMLLAVQDLALTPAEASWLDAVSPVSHVLGVAFGDEGAPEGILMLCWPDDEPLRFYETRLALALSDQLAMIAANRRLSDERQAHMAAEQASLARADHATPGAGSGPAPLGQTLKALIQEVRPTFMAAGLTLRADLATEAHVLLDASSLREVAGALLDNARRFSRPGARVRLWLAQDDAWATLYVADDGCGIPDAHQPRIGEAGFQVDPSKGGSGTGLASAKRLVTTAGGTLGFTSREGAGSTFYVSLPVADPRGGPGNA
ncbi:MAG TPA: HAMP domain-containing sensor histidine kinase [Pantanalinema sp.]